MKTKKRQEELRKKLAEKLRVDVDEIGGGFEYGQFWNGPDDYPLTPEFIHSLRGGETING